MKILIRATNWVGDAIMALPALRAVRAKFAGVHIAIVARPYVADIYRGQGVCDELIAYDPRGAEKGIGGRERLASRLREGKFDAALLLQNAFDAAWLAWRAGIAERIGYARDGRGILLTKAIEVPKVGEIPAHEQFYYLELVRRAGWADRIEGESEISLTVSRESGDAAEDETDRGRCAVARGRRARAARGDWGGGFVWIGEMLAAGAICRGGEPIDERVGRGDYFVWDGGGDGGFERDRCGDETEADRFDGEDCDCGIAGAAFAMPTFYWE